MPKMKTNRGAAKRFKRSASGMFRHRQSFRSHILTKKSTKRMRQLRPTANIAASDQKEVSRLLPYS